MSRTNEARLAFRSWMNKYGRSTCDQVVREEMRRRIRAEGREPRKRFSKRIYVELFEQQQGLCPYCNAPLDVPLIRNEIDHIDPEAELFNHRSNLRLTHRRCNREKGARALTEYSKTTGRTATEMLE